MIPRQALTSWSRQTPWGPDEQIAQDLFLCTVAVEVASDGTLAGALAWRGGTCLHRLHLPTPCRYSEDLDYVLLRGGATYAQMTASLRAIADRLGAVMSAPERSPNRYVTHFEIGAARLARPISIKLEINSADAEPALDLVSVPLAVHALGWLDAEGAPLTYQVPELLGTKFRAISERKKGRDLWDIYHATSRLRVADAPLADCAAHYLKYHDIMPSDFRQRLAANLLDPAFRQDMDTLIVGGLGSYDPIRFGRALIVWSDRWLDPRLPTHAQRQSGSPTDGLVRCPTYEWRSGNSPDAAIACRRARPVRPIDRPWRRGSRRGSEVRGGVSEDRRKRSLGHVLVAFHDGQTGIEGERVLTLTPRSCAGEGDCRARAG